MIKKLIALTALVGLTFAGSALADGAGCGLGKLVLKGKSGLVMNVLAATTNGTSASQMFGITSGTSGCNANDTVQLEQARESYVSVNFDSLSKDMAMGQGQTLSAFANLMGCSVGAQGDFARMTQEKFEVLTQDSKSLLNGVKKEIAVDPKLSAACGLS
ncbi:MAG: DUF3015 domain-containing protein [Deltaproteobacteria bacterium]|nr:DUF3015 domain-containing protein [Deltaproteobacteria bacterium]